MRARVEAPPWDTEFYRRAPMTFINEYIPAWYSVQLDNSGAGNDPGINPPHHRLSTGAVGANKVKWLANCPYAQGDVSPGQDSFAIPGDSDNVGFWERTAIFDCWVRLQAVAGTIDLTSTMGISLGIRNNFPPYPATEVANCVRLYMGIAGYTSSNAPFYLSTIPGDNATPETVTPVGPIQGRDKRVYRLRLIHVPGQYVEGLVDGQSLGKLTTSLPVPTPLNNNALCGVFVESGVFASNVRAVFTNARLQVLW